ncbi:FCD domain-containing protein [Bosea caraganae]|uniref:FCD domain-containing protein n=2 Tax=Bosea caraganae TaxID=2763117 RepID=A0A370L2H3_9HYPH|nr:FCD domain-containing protein [Bosea caraganae]RDJ30383.1 FCD domain-containing protein [Bosea caraganae]
MILYQELAEISGVAHGRRGETTLALDVLRRLRHDILICALRPRQRLRFQELKDRYRVNVGPLREALVQLASEGLVEIEPRRGCRVAAISLADLIDTTNTRVLIEKEALRQSIGEGGIEWEAQLVAAFHRLAATELNATDSGLPPEWAVAHRDFHDALTAACGSPLLREIRARLFDRANRYRMLSTLSPTHLREKSSEHRNLTESALSRNTGQALALIERHLRDTGRLAVEALRDLDPAAAPAASTQAIPSLNQHGGQS